MVGRLIGENLRLREELELSLCIRHLHAGLWDLSRDRLLDLLRLRVCCVCASGGW